MSTESDQRLPPSVCQLGCAGCEWESAFDPQDLAMFRMEDRVRELEAQLVAERAKVAAMAELLQPAAVADVCVRCAHRRSTHSGPNGLCQGSECHRHTFLSVLDQDQGKQSNVCEHGDHAAPDGQRFCSERCKDCEMADAPAGTDCANLCGQESEADRG